MTCKHILPMESNVSSYLQHSVSGPWICPWCERDALAMENARLEDLLYAFLLKWNDDETPYSLYEAAYKKLGLPERTDELKARWERLSVQPRAGE